MLCGRGQRDKMYKNLDIWLPSYIKQCMSRDGKFSGLKHVMFCVADHFEPKWGSNAAVPGKTFGRSRKASDRIDTWMERFPNLAKKHRDTDGKSPQHTFFYPIEEYEPDHLDKIADLSRKGFGEVEIHLHHDNDTASGLRDKIEKGKVDFKRHGLLSRDKKSKEIKFGFVHGNWALDNSRRDGRWCGVNNELEVLKEVGCFADFTLPSVPSDTQTRKINSIYYAQDDPKKPKSHNTGVDVVTASVPGKALPFPESRLMIIQGPLALNWRRKKFNIFPKIENGEITGINPPIPDRIDLWVKQNISVKGKEDWIFIKVYTHGAQERNFDCLLGRPMHDMYSYLEEKYNDGVYFKLHYVTAREMFNIIKAAEAGEKGEPGEYRDYEVVT